MTKNILLDTVRISGFRGLKNFEMSMSRVTVLIGANNSGKTSLIKALQLALGNWSRFISEEDFYISPNDTPSNEIIVDIRFVPVDKDGKRSAVFAEKWQETFSDSIKSEGNKKQFVAMRTCINQDKVKGGFECFRYILQSWPDNSSWREKIQRDKDKTAPFLNIPFISIEAQRDIHHELKDKYSYAGKVLANVKYLKVDIDKIENQIQKLNKNAIDKSEDLKDYRENLKQLHQSFQGDGNIEITPFPKKLRDLSKHFSIHFGDNQNGVFSMEYHGMGTRSWASMLTVKAFLEASASKHDREDEPFFPILAAEEPEAHLHPNAQKTLYQQLAEIKGQVIISTHSSYIAAMANISDIRALRKSSRGVVLNLMTGNITDKDKKELAREIISKHGEILFSRAIILCEGVTDEQIIPAMFELCIGKGKTLFSLGIACVNVNGNRYSPFIRLACSLGIPTYIISDNDKRIKIEIESQINNLKRDFELELGNDVFGISFLRKGNDIEAELLNIPNMKNNIIEALILSETKDLDNKQELDKKTTYIKSLNDGELLTIMRKSKTSYSRHLADFLLDSNHSCQDIPDAVKNAINQIKEWCNI